MTPRHPLCYNYVVGRRNGPSITNASTANPSQSSRYPTHTTYNTMKKRFALPLIFGGLLVVAALPNVEGSQSAKDAAKRAAAPATAPVESKLGPDEGA